MVGAQTMTRNYSAKTPMSVSGTMPLTMAGQGETRTICCIRGKDDTRRFLANMGFVEQESVQIISEFGGNLIVAVKGARVAVSRAMASWILVR